jgi:hypothetical protein
MRREGSSQSLRDESSKSEVENEAQVKRILSDSEIKAE